jgi:hypothetical protein
LKLTTSIHLHNVIIALMIEAASTSETSVNFNKTTRRNIPEDSHHHLHNVMFESIGITLPFA